MIEAIALTASLLAVQVCESTHPRFDPDKVVVDICGIDDQPRYKCTIPNPDPQ